MHEEKLRRILTHEDPALEEKLREAAQDAKTLLALKPKTLCEIGIKRRNAILPQLFSDVMSRCAMEEMEKESFLKAGSARVYLTWLFRTLREPGCVWLLLDRKGRIAERVVLSQGKKFFVRELVDIIQEESLRYKSSRGIVAHNYEKSIPQNLIPFIADADHTFRALRMMGIELIDYILVSGTETVSVFQRIGG